MSTIIRPKKPASPKWSAERVFLSTKLELRAASVDAGAADALPAGVCARMTGVALVYNTADDYGTMFLPGSLAKTRAERVATGKVKLFADHGPFTDTHVGVVRSVDDVGDAVVMTADLFDTESGRAMKEYLQAVLASGADTGLSIGFRPRDKEWIADDDGDMVCVFKEIELREISITPVPAVPGADVTSIRREAGEEDDALLRRALRSILTSLPERDARSVFDEVYPDKSARTEQGAAPPETSSAAAPDASLTGSTPGASTAASAESGAESASGNGLATEAERLRAVRMSYAQV